MEEDKKISGELDRLSLSEILGASELQEKVYKIHNKYLDQDETNTEEVKFVQIKRYEFESILRSVEVIQNTDISKQILYDQEKMEKNLLTMINATVSHDMRNPCNSIQSQHIRQEQICLKLNDLIFKEAQGPQNKKLRKKLKKIQKEFL